MINIDTIFFKIKIFDRVYYVEHISSWDHRIAKNYIDIAEKLITENLSGQPWSILADFRKWTLNTPEAEKLLREHFKKRQRSGLSCISTIVDDSKIKKWQLERISRNHLPERSRFFSDVPEAILWLKKLGFIDVP